MLKTELKQTPKGGEGASIIDVGSAVGLLAQVLLVGLLLLSAALFFIGFQLRKIAKK